MTWGRGRRGMLREKEEEEREEGGGALLDSLAHVEVYARGAHAELDAEPVARELDAVLEQRRLRGGGRGPSRVACTP